MFKELFLFVHSLEDDMVKGYYLYYGKREKRRMPVKKESFLKKILPAYAWMPVIVAFGIQLIVYCGLKIIVERMPLHDMTTALDRSIPFVPQWIIIYVLSYASWAFTIRWILMESKEKCYPHYRTIRLCFCKMKPYGTRKVK